jgi:hypothetical protein
MRSPADAGGHEQISPELVLVDPALRRLLLQSPPEVPRWAVHPTAVVIAHPATPRRASWRSQLLIAAAAAAVTAAVVIVPGGASPTPSVQRPSAVATATPAPPRTFAWIAAPGAAAYKFALYRGSTIVYEAITTKQQLTLPSMWRQQGMQRKLLPGRYRWYVWALDRSGATAAGKRALVQATLEVPPH